MNRDDIFRSIRSPNPLEETMERIVGAVSGGLVARHGADPTEAGYGHRMVDRLAARLREVPPTIFTVNDPDVQGQVPVIRSADAFGFTTGVDVTAAGDPVGYYVAIVEPSCAASGFQLALRQRAVAR